MIRGLHKQTIRRLTTLLLFAPLLTTCSRDDSGYIEPARQQVTLAMSLTSYAPASGDPLADAQDTRVHSAYVYIFNDAGQLENDGSAAVPADGTGEVIVGGVLNRTWSVPEGPKTLYVVLNAGGIRLGDATVSLDDYRPETMAELEALTTDPATFLTDFDPEGTQGVLMTGKGSYTVTKTDLRAAVPVVRRYARIDLSLRRAADVAQEITIKRVTLSSQRRSGLLLAALQELSGPDLALENDFTDIVLPAGTDFTPVTTFYTLPRPVEEGITAARLDIVLDNAGVEQEITAWINAGAVGGNENDPHKPLALEANKIYRVNATLTRGGIDMALNILDWKDIVADGDVAGSELHVPARFAIERTGERAETRLPFRSREELTAVVEGTQPSWLQDVQVENRAGAGDIVFTTAADYQDAGERYPDAVLTLRAGSVARRLTVSFLTREEIDALPDDWADGDVAGDAEGDRLFVPATFTITRTGQGGVSKLPFGSAREVTAAETVKPSWLVSTTVTNRPEGGGEILFTTAPDYADANASYPDAKITLTTGSLVRQVTVRYRSKEQIEGDLADGEWTDDGVNGDVNGNTLFAPAVYYVKNHTAGAVEELKFGSNGTVVLEIKTPQSWLTDAAIRNDAAGGGAVVLTTTPDFSSDANYSDAVLALRIGALERDIVVRYGAKFDADGNPLDWTDDPTGGDVEGATLSVPVAFAIRNAVPDAVTRLPYRATAAVTATITTPRSWLRSVAVEHAAGGGTIAFTTAPDATDAAHVYPTAVVTLQAAGVTKSVVVSFSAPTSIDGENGSDWQDGSGVAGDVLGNALTIGTPYYVRSHRPAAEEEIPFGSNGPARVTIKTSRSWLNAASVENNPGGGGAIRITTTPDFSNDENYADAVLTVEVGTLYRDITLKYKAKFDANGNPLDWTDGTTDGDVNGLLLDIPATFTIRNAVAGAATRLEFGSNAPARAAIAEPQEWLKSIAVENAAGGGGAVVFTTAPNVAHADTTYPPAAITVTVGGVTKRVAVNFSATTDVGGNIGDDWQDGAENDGDVRGDILSVKPVHKIGGRAARTGTDEMTFGSSGRVAAAITTPVPWLRSIETRNNDAGGGGSVRLAIQYLPDGSTYPDAVVTLTCGSVAKAVRVQFPTEAEMQSDMTTDTGDDWTDGIGTNGSIAGSGLNVAAVYTIVATNPGSVHNLPYRSTDPVSVTVTTPQPWLTGIHLVENNHGGTVEIATTPDESDLFKSYPDAVLTFTVGSVKREVKVQYSYGAQLVVAPQYEIAALEADQSDSFVFGSTAPATVAVTTPAAWLLDAAVTNDPDGGGKVTLTSRCDVDDPEKSYPDAVLTLSAGGIEKRITVKYGFVSQLTTPASVTILNPATGNVDRQGTYTSNCPVKVAVKTPQAWLLDAAVENNAGPDYGGTLVLTTAPDDGANPDKVYPDAVVTLTLGTVSRDVTVQYDAALSVAATPSIASNRIGSTHTISYTATAAAQVSVVTGQSWLSSATTVNNASNTGGTVVLATTPDLADPSKTYPDAVLRLTSGGFSREIRVSYGFTVELSVTSTADYTEDGTKSISFTANCPVSMRVSTSQDWLRNATIVNNPDYSGGRLNFEIIDQGDITTKAGITLSVGNQSRTVTISGRVSVVLTNISLVIKKTRGYMKWTTAMGIDPWYEGVNDYGSTAMGPYNTGCNTLNVNGVSGWRLPTKREAEVMVAYFNILWDEGAFDPVLTQWECTAEEVGYNSGQIYVINWDERSVRAISKTSKFAARCVRDLK